MDNTLLSQLQSGKPNLRRAAAYKMGKSKEFGYIPYLILGYGDTDSIVRQNIIEALRLLPTDQSKEFLTADEAGRMTIIKRMNEAPAEKKFDHDLSTADKVLVYELRSGKPKERRAAAYKLGKTNDPVFVPYLIGVYNDPDPILRQNVLDALRQMPTDRAREFVRASETERMDISKKINEVSPEKQFINELTLDHKGRTAFLERLKNSSPEEQEILIGELNKMFGAKSLEWWQASAQNHENKNKGDFSRVIIPAPSPGNIASRLLVTGAAIALTGDVNDGLIAGSDVPSMVLNEKIKIPSTCNLCGIYDGENSVTVTREVDFSQLGAALGGSFLSRRKVELRVPHCYHCGGFEGLLPGVSIEGYEKVDNQWQIVLSFINHSIASQYLDLNHGRIYNPVPQAPVAPAAPLELKYETQGDQSVSILVHWPGVGVVKDQPISIFLDDQLAGTGMFKKGFDFQIHTCAGVHKLSTSSLLGIRKPAVVTFTAEKDRHYRVDLTYSRSWGNFSLSCTEVKT